MEQLYLPVEGEQLTRQAKTVLFLCQYCGWDLFEVRVVQIASQGVSKRNETHRETSFEQKSCKADKLFTSYMYIKGFGENRNAGQTYGDLGTSTCGGFKALDEHSVGNPSAGKPSARKVTVEKLTVKDHSLGQFSLGKCPVESLSGEPIAVTEPPNEPSFVREHSVKEPFIGKPPARACPIKDSVSHCVEPCEVKHIRSSSQGRTLTNGLAKISLQPWDGVPEGIIVEDLQDVDWLVQQCCLPAIVGSGGQTCYTGLCAVLRRIVKKVQERCPQRNHGALLGYKQACLKKCCEVSPWTRLCEIDIYQDLNVNGVIPSPILEIEKRLESPLNISSKVLGKKKKKEADVNPVSSQMGLQSVQELVVPESIFQMDALHLTDKRKIKSAKCLYKKRAKIKTRFERKLEHAVVAKPKTPCIDCQDELESSLSEDAGESSSAFKDLGDVCTFGSENNLSTNGQSEFTEAKTSSVQMDSQTKIMQASLGNKLTKKEQLEQCHPHPERLFLEGPYVTLADFALFHSLHSYQQKCIEAGRGHDLFRDIPLVRRWYHRMWTVPNVRDCAQRCGLEEILVSNELTEESATTKDKTQAEKVVGPETDKYEAKQEKMNKMIKISQLPSVKNRVSDILSRLEAGGVDVAMEDLPTKNTQLPWNEFPEEVNPSQDVSEERAVNKRQQIESLLVAIKMIAKPGDIIVDFCSGGGHVGIVLAHCLPDCCILLIENNEESVKRAENRIRGSRLSNIFVYQCNVNYYTGMFNIGVCLHACGVATDLVLAKCLQRRASFVCSPCCYGSLRDSHLISYPRSQRLQSLPLSYEEYSFLGHIAEQTSRDFDSEMAKQAKICMSIIDLDRAEAAREEGYWVRLYSLTPPTCSPKNNLLIGRPVLDDHSKICPSTCQSDDETNGKSLSYIKTTKA